MILSSTVLLQLRKHTSGDPAFTRARRPGRFLNECLLLIAASGQQDVT